MIDVDMAPVDMFSPLLVSQNSNSVFVLEFSRAREYVSLLFLPNLGIVTEGGMGVRLGDHETDCSTNLRFGSLPH